MGPWICWLTSRKLNAGGDHCDHAPNDFHITRVDRSADHVLRNLFEHYLHDMAQWFEFDTEIDGRYAYSTGEVWDKGYDVYFAYTAAMPIGFALVGSAETWTNNAAMRDMDEFFVMRRYRRHGVGAAFANYLWDQYPGDWLVRVLQGNLPAMPFWRGIIATRTANEFHEEARISNQRPWSYFTFISANFKR